MGVDDDIAAQLPEPPPPAPSRRQRTIDEALRRFDAAHGAQPMIEPASASAGRAPWWRRIGPPQAAALVTVALIALFGVPAAWLSVGQRSAPVSRTQLASTADVAAGRAVPAPSINPPSATPSAGVRPSAVPAPVVAPTPDQPAAAADRLLAKDEIKEMEERNMPKAAAVSAAPVELARAEPATPAEARPSLMHAKPASASRVDRPVELADAAMPRPAAMMAAPAPPPPPPAMAASADAATTAYSNLAASAGMQAAKAREPRDMIASAQPRAETMKTVAAGNIVVTARRRVVRRPAGRGDWNACTINDPARSLQRCKGQIDPAAAGPTGRAAAQVADGLTRAWQGDLDGAIAAFDRAIATAPHDAAAYLNRGLALQRKGEFSRAAADLDRAVRYAPGAARGYYNRGQLQRQRGEADRAAADEDRAVALDPGYEAVVE